MTMRQALKNLMQGEEESGPQNESDMMREDQEEAESGPNLNFDSVCIVESCMNTGS
jgi:hypothetical protein